MNNKKLIVLIIFIIIVVILAIAFMLYSRTDLGQDEMQLENESNSYANYIEEDNTAINETVQENTGNQQETTNNNGATISGGSENMNNHQEEIKINLIVNNKTFSATLENNQTVRELISNFPMTLNMSDLHSNEKYNNLSNSLTTNSSTPSRINAGDIKLFGNNCLVVFYKSFSNSYSYTDLGKVDNVNDFVDELGRGNVTIRFELAN